MKEKTRSQRMLWMTRLQLNRPVRESVHSRADCTRIHSRARWLFSRLSLVRTSDMLRQIAILDCEKRGSRAKVADSRCPKRASPFGTFAAAAVAGG